MKENSEWGREVRESEREAHERELDFEGLIEGRNICSRSLLRGNESKNEKSEKKKKK